MDESVEQTTEPYRATRQMAFAALQEVYDPEIGLNVVELGLVYNVDWDDNKPGLLVVDLTLTTPYCPYGPQLISQADAMCRTLPGVEDVKINIVWEPPWDPKTMASDEAKLMLGIY